MVNEIALMKLTPVIAYSEVNTANIVTAESYSYKIVIGVLIVQREMGTAYKYIFNVTSIKFIPSYSAHLYNTGFMYPDVMICCP